MSYNYQFQLDGTLFQLLNALDTLDTFDGNSQYDVSVLQFAQGISLLHWCIYLQSYCTRRKAGLSTTSRTI